LPDVTQSGYGFLWMMDLPIIRCSVRLGEYWIY
jgi:hypothetical protein